MFLKFLQLTSFFLVFHICGVQANTFEFTFVGDTNSSDIRLSLELETQAFKNSPNNIVIANLETVVSDLPLKTEKCRLGAPHCFAFKNPTSMLPRLKDLGVVFVSIANNHARDYGDKGLQETKDNLDKMNIFYSGFGKDYAYIFRENKKICFSAFATNLAYNNIIDIASATKLIHSLKQIEKCDFVIVSFHGGCEGAQYKNVPDKTEFCYGENRGNVREFATKAIDAGAKLVFGHGPHVTRMTETYNGGHILYSLGNFSVHNNMSIFGPMGESEVIKMQYDENFNFIQMTKIPIILQKGFTQIKTSL